MRQHRRYSLFHLSHACDIVPRIRLHIMNRKFYPLALLVHRQHQQIRFCRRLDLYTSKPFIEYMVRRETVPLLQFMAFGLFDLILPRGIIHHEHLDKVGVFGNVRPSLREEDIHHVQFRHIVHQYLEQVLVLHSLECVDPELGVKVFAWGIEVFVRLLYLGFAPIGIYLRFPSFGRTKRKQRIIPTGGALGVDASACTGRDAYQGG